ncbi:hypothetical protein AURDEDRAFT_160597 [Auricularia subglabra TFB-10046 SS5]|nr:hypothetical protein AURDEDRAFT_160597 [Auricularia subglabra TFB-10046 SS5]
MSGSESDTSSSSSDDDKKKKKKKQNKKKKSEKTPDKTPSKAAEKCKWTAPQSALVLETLHELKDDHQAESGWKESVWTVCAERLEAQFPDAEGAPKTAPKCQDHFTNLKGDFKIVKELRARSGLGWDSVTCTVTAAPDVWERTCKANSKFKKWRRKAFPLFDTMADLIGDVVATGEGALLLTKQPNKEGKVKPSNSKPKEDADDSKHVLAGPPKAPP